MWSSSLILWLWLLDRLTQVNGWGLETVMTTLMMAYFLDKIIIDILDYKLITNINYDMKYVITSYYILLLVIHLYMHELAMVLHHLLHLRLSSAPWPKPATFDDVWGYLGLHFDQVLWLIYGFYMDILYIYIYLFMVIYGYIWLYMVIYGYTWLYVVTYGYIWLYMVHHSCRGYIVTYGSKM